MRVVLAAMNAVKGQVDANLQHHTEFKLLGYLMSNVGRVLSKGQILDHVWAYDFGGEGGIVELYVSYLRRKVDTAEPRLIHTIRGVGYVLRPRSRSRGGTGLGLAIVAALVAAHQGSVEVDAGPGCGATFRVQGLG
jgi:hypothetical protein